MPAIQRSNVVFPAPLGADIRQISPAATDRLSGANKGETIVLASASERENEALVTCNIKFISVVSFQYGCSPDFF
jgi:hypothetical protein